MMTMENDGGVNPPTPPPWRHCTLLIESDIVMVSRKSSPDLKDILGFIEWNRFCDRLDKSLEPIRNLVEEAQQKQQECHHGFLIKEQLSAAAKTRALESLQASCDKLSTYMNHNKSIELNFALYCPFHSPDNGPNLVNNWHIQLSYQQQENATDIISRDQQQQQQQQDRQPQQQGEGRQVSITQNNDSTLMQSPALVVAEDAAPSGGEERSLPPTNHATGHDQSQHHNTSTPTQLSQQLNQNEETIHTAAVASTDSPPTTSTAPKTNSYRKGHGKLGVLGVDYIEHQVQPNDTLKGICLKYNISAFRLRQTNLLSGENESLLIAPHKVLAIPLIPEGNNNKDGGGGGSGGGKDGEGGYYSRVQETESIDYKLNSLRKKFPKLSQKEATAYLELSDWVLVDAVASVKEDFEWEKETKDDFF